MTFLTNKISHFIHGGHKLMNDILTILISNTANKQAKKKKKYFSLLFVEMLHKFTNDRISKKMIMMHIWIGFKTKLKRDNRNPVQRGKTRNFSFLFYSFSFTQQNQYERNKQSMQWFEKTKSHFSHQLLWKKDTESVFTVFWLRTAPFLLFFVPLFLLDYCLPFSQ